VAAAAGVIALVSPRRIEAQFASPVQVKNTSAAPALTSTIDDPGRIPYQSSVNMSGKCPPGGSTCFWEFGSPPAGHRIVIQHISGTVSFNGTPISIPVNLNNGSGLLASFLAPFANFSSFSQPVQAYFDPANIIEVQIFLIEGTYPNPPDSFTEVITLTGYELDCTAAPCAAIAH
jgi:hypothetical protein